ncbi:Zn-dependent hydrolase [Ethanoligenens sp.]|uniref:Zn-dependent hydrolase n=1 Tax=Ethanoligenens sp. TaxID=2099655 RepID=UPI0039E8AD50
MLQKLSTDTVRSDIETLAGFHNPNKPGFTRRAFTEEDQEARRWLCSQMEGAGLNVRTDAMANLIGLLPGVRPELPVIMIGSHADTVNSGGRFDGMVGVLAGIEIARLLKQAGTRLHHSLEIVDFTSEEPSDFGLSTIGSRGMAGELHDNDMLRTDQSGRTLSDAVCALGGKRDFHLARRKRGEIALYLELHIEQGPVLEQKGCKLGVVTGIVGIHRYRVTVNGRQNHAGTTPMGLRQDALTGAGELILLLEKLCREKEDCMVGTVGKLSVEPNAANVIPGHCMFEFEIRSLHTDIMEKLSTEFILQSERIAQERGLEITFDPLSKSVPLQVRNDLQTVMWESCEKVASTMCLHSGAGHDANHIGRIAPMAMLFVPSKDGESHCPEEYTAYEDITAGVQALLNALLTFDEMVELKHAEKAEL